MSVGLSSSEMKRYTIILTNIQTITLATFVTSYIAMRAKCRNDEKTKCASNTHTDILNQTANFSAGNQQSWEDEKMVLLIEYKNS